MLPIVFLLMGWSEARPPKPDLTYQPHDNFVPIADFCFASGLRIIAQADPSRPLVAVRSIHSGGASADPANLGGTAHLAEHLWFRTDAGSGTEVRQHYAAIGAVANAVTATDYVAFEVEVPRRRLVSLLSLEAGRMLAPLQGIDDEMVIHETSVLEHERMLRQTLGPVPHLIAGLFGGEHRFARTQETASSVADIRLDDLTAFARTHWIPAHTTMVVVGDLDLERFSATIMEAFPRSLLEHPDRPGPLDGACPQRLTEARPAPPDPVRRDPVEIVAPIEEARVQVGWTLPGAYREDHYVLRFAAALVDKIMRREAAEMRTTHGFGNPARCSLTPFADATILICEVSVNPAVPPDRALRYIRSGLATLRSTDLKWSVGSTLEHVYASERRRIEAGLDDASFWGRARALGHHAHLTGSARPTRDALDQLDTVTFAQVDELLKRWVTADRMATVIVQPNGGALMGWSEQQAVEVPAGHRPAAPRVDAVALAAKIGPPALSRIQTRTLDNGLQVVVVGLDGSPMVRTGLLLPGGEWAAAEPAVPWVTWATTDLWYTHGDFSNYYAPEQILGRWSIVHDDVGHSLSLSGAAGNLEDQLFLLWDLTRRVDPDPSDRISLKQFVRRVERRIEDNASAAIAEEVMATLYPTLEPTEALSDQIREVNGAEIRRWHRSVWQPDHATVLIVGQVDPGEALDRAEAWFMNWKPGKVAAPGPIRTPTPGPVEDRVLVAREPLATVASVQLHCPVAGDMATDVLGAHLRTVAHETLRYGEGKTYGVYGRVRPAGSEAVLTLSTATTPDAVASVIAELKALLGSAGAALSADDLAYAKASEASRIRRQFDGRDGLFHTLSAGIRSGRTLDDITEPYADLAAVTAAEVVDRALACATHPVFAVVGPAGAVDDLDRAQIAWRDVR